VLSYPEVGVQGAATVVAELSDEEMVLVHDVDVAANMVGVGLPYFIIKIYR
jgi:hypothetical protein